MSAMHSCLEVQSRVTNVNVTWAFRGPLAEEMQVVANEVIDPWKVIESLRLEVEGLREQIRYAPLLMSASTGTP